MKFIFFFLILFSLKAQSQQIEVIKFKAVEVAEIEDDNVYLIDNDDFDSLLNVGNSEYKLIYTYAAWCRPCIETLPKVLDLIEKNKNEIDFYVISPEDENDNNEFHKIRYRLKEAGYKGPIFNISNKHSKRFKKKYISFVENISTEIKDYGLSLILFFDKDKNLLISSTYLKDKEHYLDQIQQILDSN